MYIAEIPNRHSPPCILLRESYREGGKVRNRTIANLTRLPKPALEVLRKALNGETTPCVDLESSFEITASRAHGHVHAVLGTMEQLGMKELLHRSNCRERELALALVAARLIAPRSKLATLPVLTQQTTLTEELELGEVPLEDVYTALDWLLKQQLRVERCLAKKHLSDRIMVLYDVSSSYFEGRHCPLARYGHSRDQKRNKLQIVYGLICTKQGCPIAVEVFEGNTADPTTFSQQLARAKERFGTQEIIWVGDRGMITSARITEELKHTPGVGWITALRSEQIRALIRSGSIELSIFDKQDLVEIVHQDFPGERLVVCKNHFLAQERARTREALLLATEKELVALEAATKRKKNPLRGKVKIALRLGKILEHSQVGKHFTFDITKRTFTFNRNATTIEAESQLDGFYVIRTSVSTEQLSTDEAVLSYKALSGVERAFRSLKTVDLKIRPIFHHLADRVRAHVFLCMLAYYVEWHMRQKLAPLLFDDEHKDPYARRSVVAKAQRSESALQKADTQFNDEQQLPVQSFQSLIATLGTLCRATCMISTHNVAFEKTARPNNVQSRAFALLGVAM